MNNLGIREESLMTLLFLAWENMWMGLSLAKVMKAVQMFTWHRRRNGQKYGYNDSWAMAIGLAGWSQI